MLHESGLLNDLQDFAMARHFVSMITPAYPMQIHFQAPYKEGNLTRDQKSYYKAMKGVRITVEWLSGEIKTYFKFFDFKT